MKPPLAVGVRPGLQQLLETLATHPSPAVRAEAALLIDRACDPAALGPLLVAIGDPDFFVRSNAGWALVHLGAIARPYAEAVAANSLSDDAREMARLILERISK